MLPRALYAGDNVISWEVRIVAKSNVLKDYGRALGHYPLKTVLNCDISNDAAAFIGEHTNSTIFMCDVPDQV
jgi:hypothetical protein